MSARATLWVRIAVSAVVLLWAFAAHGEGEIREFWAGHGTAYSGDRVTPLFGYQLEVEAVIRGAVVVSTFTITPDDGKNPLSVVCISLLLPKGRSILSCGEGSGEGVRIGSMLQNTLRYPDGTTSHTTWAIDDGGERRRSIRTRIAADGSVLDYFTESLLRIE